MKINTRKYIEEYIKIRDKPGKIIPLKLNAPQEKLYNIIKDQKQKGEPVKVIILKARQMGFSTLTEAILFKETATKFNARTGVIAHIEEATNNLFSMFKLMYEKLPIELQPTKKNSNAKELLFDNKEGTGLKSGIRCMTAGGKGVGRSSTFNRLHISELAFWPGDKEEALNGLLQTVPNLPDTIIIIESTANGYDHFKTLWDKAVSGKSSYIPLFVGWNELTDYSMTYTGYELTDDEERLKELYNLTNDQITWRRWCIENNCGGDTDKFKQEYPINPQEAFLSTGSCVFDKEKIIERIQQLKEPLKTGYFEFDYTDNIISNIRWQDDKKGYIKLFKLPEDIKYAIGGDTSGEGSDSFTASVIDARTLEQVAVMKHQFDADQYARQIYCLGMYYKYALIGIESNFDSYPLRELERLKYKKMYIRERPDTYTGQILKSYGFKTTSATRPLIISQMIEVAREQIDTFNDKDTLEEMLTFIKNERGRAEAQIGSHDDLVMAHAIALEIKKQVKFEKIIQLPSEKTFSFGNSNKSKKYTDYGEEIQII